MKTPEQIAAETAEKIVPILVNDSYLSYREDAAKLILAALTEHAKGLEARILSDNKAYGCELRDPNGTIWEYAETLKKRVDELENELAKVQLVADHRAKTLTELEADRERLEYTFTTNRYFSDRATIDSARNAQPAANTGDNRRTEDKL